MIDQITALIIDEGKWLTISLSFALLAVLILLFLHRRSNHRLRTRILAGMNLFFSVTIGTMAFGHLLAVTTKLILGTLEGSVLLFYVIGIVLAVPAWSLIYHTWERFNSGKGYGQMTIILNAWLGLTLLALGIHNLPLAVPAIFNIGYYVHTRWMIGWAIVSLTVVINLSLFIGSIIFWASGQSFEQFQGIQ